MALGLGRYNPMPFRLGGGDSTVEIEHAAILDSLSKSFDISDGTEVFEEAFVDAMAVALVWAVNERLRNQVIPSRMMENLATWEQACGLRPTPADRPSERRAKLEARLRGVANNTVTDIEEVSRAIFGVNFVAVVPVDPLDWIVYWPGINPGPPGLEWATNRVRVAIRVSTDGLTNSLFIDKRSALANQLDAMLPSWMGYAIGVGSSFVVNLGVVGQTFL